MKKIKELVEQFTTDEGIDYDKLEEAINKETNDIIAKQTDPDKLTSKAVEKVIADLGIDGNSVDDLKLYIKKMGGSTDEFKEQNIKLEKELQATQEERDKLAQEKQSIETEYTTTQQMSKLKALGVDDERAEFLHYKLSKEIGEDKDFDTVLNAYKEEHGDDFRKKETSFRRVPNQNSQNGGEDNLEAVWEAKYGKK